ncbi:hypothetical protein [Paenibacillus radicis (ex Xue et al. 2023)]|uniref:Uncharacterized protein n=1 Tax=Paenibacillus radicis (ex Xue et al. 2023) TaxID=2972489 RepID=A0ABT1YTQ8_9BACL|nr:hypothetical protein [Paenibacillus radicis (ex Xue et al. 2023)]MCR8636387.1 hypothetical protein [Paenibacillus radicis (ex Xue et al. 2023)]
MKIKVQLSIGDQMVKEENLSIAETKLGELTDEEIEQAIEINIRTWADKMIRIHWEVAEED